MGQSEYFPDSVVDECSSARPIRWDWGWHQDTERGQKWALC